MGQKLIGFAVVFVGKMCAHVLCHTLDKVRYFRNLLVTEDTRPRILIGTDRLLHTLDMAVKDMKGVPVNGLAIVTEWLQIRYVESDTMTDRETILIYVRRVHDTFANAIMEEHGDCEVVVFEGDPTLD
jgi:hypothetical protein